MANDQVKKVAGRRASTRHHRTKIGQLRSPGRFPQRVEPLGLWAPALQGSQGRKNREALGSANDCSHTPSPSASKHLPLCAPKTETPPSNTGLGRTLKCTLQICLNKSTTDEVISNFSANSV